MSDVDLYTALGLGLDATKDEIKKAYNAWMKEHHPDLNEGQEHPDHHAVQLAYDTLIDDDARAMYDETGEIKAPNSVHDSAVAKILTMLQQIFSTCDLERVDLKAEIMQKLRADQQHANAFIKQSDKEYEQLKRVMDRSKPKEKTMFITHMMESICKTIDENVARAENDLVVIAYAMKLMEDYDYESVRAIPGQSGPQSQAWSSFQRPFL